MIDIPSVPRSAYVEHAPSEQLMAEVADVQTQDVALSKQIGFTLLNRHLIGENSPIVAVGGYFSDLTTPDRAWEGVQLAALERPILMLDLPGHGLSSPHSTRQAFDLCIRRSADSQAAPLTEAVQKIFPDDNQADYFGISHGALMVMKMAEQDPQDRIETVFGIDLPAIKRRWTLGLQLGYMVTDNIVGRKKYLEAIEGTQHEADFEQFEDDFELLGVERADNFIKNNPGLFALNMFSSINARPVALQSWKTVLDETSTTRVELVTSENGSVSDPEEIQDFIDSLSPEQQARSHQTVVPGEDHNIGIVHLMPRAVAWAERAYDEN